MGQTLSMSLTLWFKNSASCTVYLVVSGIFVLLCW
jgi:hypothetical protein